MLDLGDLVGRILMDDSQVGDVVGRLPGKLGAAGPGMAAAGAGIGVGIGVALSSSLMGAANAEAANDKLASQLGLTEAESARIGGVAGKLYADAYGENIEDVNGAVAAVMSSVSGMANAPSGELEAMTAKMMNLSTAMEIDVGRAAQVAGQMITNGLAKDGTQAADLLTAGLQKVPAALREDLLDAIDEYGPNFTALGMSGEAAFEMLVDASAKGMYGIDKTGDALKEFTIRSTDMSTLTKDAYKSIGLDAGEMANKVLAGGDQAAEGLYMTAQGLLEIQDPAERANAAIALFGTPLEDLSTEDIPKFLESLMGASGTMDDAGGAADRMGSALNGNAKTSWVELQRTMEGMLNGVGTTLLPVLQGFLDWANQNPAILQLVAVAVGILAAAFVALSIAMWAASITPVGLMIAGIVIAVGLLVAAIAWLVLNWDEAWAWVTSTFEAFTGWLQGKLDELTIWWSATWEGFLTFLSDAWNAMVSFLVETSTNITLTLLGWGLSVTLWWVGLWDGFVGMLSDAWNRMTAWIGTAIANIVAGFIAWGIGLAAWWVGLWQSFWTNLSNAWNGIMGFLAGIPAWVLGVFSNALNWLVNTGRDIFTGMRRGIDQTWSTVSSWMASVPGLIMDALSGAASWLYETGQDVFSGLLKGLKSAFDGVMRWIRGAAQDVADAFAAVLDIHSPSRVFASFGMNIGEGLIVGLDRVQPSVDRRMAEMTTIPVVDMALRPDVGMVAAARYGTASGSGAPTAGTTVDARLIVENAGYSMEELERMRSERLGDALEMAGISTVGVSS